MTTADHAPSARNFGVVGWRPSRSLPRRSGRLRFVVRFANGIAGTDDAFVGGFQRQRAFRRHASSYFMPHRGRSTMRSMVRSPCRLLRAEPTLHGQAGGSDDGRDLTAASRRGGLHHRSRSRGRSYTGGLRAAGRSPMAAPPTRSLILPGLTDDHQRHRDQARRHSADDLIDLARSTTNLRPPRRNAKPLPDGRISTSRCQLICITHHQQSHHVPRHGRHSAWRTT